MNSDCFAAASRYGAPYCKCLTDVVCENGGKCTFYKTNMQFLHDLVTHNGTTDLRQISANYAAGHIEKGENK
jgi:hypothetical protein